MRRRSAGAKQWVILFIPLVAVALSGTGVSRLISNIDGNRDPTQEGGTGISREVRALRTRGVLWKDVGARIKDIFVV
jgi:hypothetical protein